MAFDTNALIYFLEGIEPYYSQLRAMMQAVWQGSKEGVVSVVTEAELLVKPIREADTVVIGRIDDLFSQANLSVVPVSRPIARTSAAVRARTGLFLADAIIIATAMESGCDAVVGNDAMCAQRVKEIPYLYLEHLVHH